MWSLLDLGLRILMLAAWVFMFWAVWQLTRVSSAARLCLSCHQELKSVDVVHCGNCLRGNNV